jgi:hypothetical protein
MRRAALVRETVGPALKLMILVAVPVMLLTDPWPDLSLAIPRLPGLL